MKNYRSSRLSTEFSNQSMIRAQDGSNTYRMKISDPKRGMKEILIGYSGVTIDKLNQESITHQTHTND